MVAGLEPLVVFWTGWGIHLMVVVSFTVQVTLLVLSDIRRRKGWALLNMIIWAAYMLADTTAVYALGHMSVVCRSPEHHLMALWAPLLLVHLGGQDNITAYAIEDNRLWLRHLLTFLLQVAAAGYVLYVSSILSHPNKVSWAAILMLVVGVLKYGERIWALKRANSYCSSSLSATSYSSKVVCRPISDQHQQLTYTAVTEAIHLKKFANYRVQILVMADSMLDVAKQMFEGPTSYVQTGNNQVQEGRNMLDVVEQQLSMMYDLLYTKAAVVHTWYGFCSRILISLPFTIAALTLFRSSSMSHDVKDAAGPAGLDYYKREDVTITNVLLTGAVVLETMSVLRAIFSEWTAILLYARGWNIMGTVVLIGELFLKLPLLLVVQGEEITWSGRMRQHNLFVLTFVTGYSTGSKIAKWVGLEDWWDSKFYSWSTPVPDLVLEKVLELASTPGAGGDIITRSRGLNAIRRSINNNRLVTWIWMEELKLEESILVWHIATHVYLLWSTLPANPDRVRVRTRTHLVREATRALTDYMFFLLASRPYMLPYPVSRQAYLQLCSDVATNMITCRSADLLLDAILRQKKDLIEGTPLQPDEGIGRQRNDDDRGTTTGAPNHLPSMNSTLDKGCQLAAKLIHITAPTVQRWKPNMITIPEETETFSEETETFWEETETFSGGVILNMLFEVWTEMLCYTAYLCNENNHAKHLTDGGEIMTIITLLMIYVKNGLIRENTSTGGGTAGPSSQGATATDSLV